MILRHAKDPVEGQPIENTFCAIDERSGDLLGSSVIYTDYNPMLFPTRPQQVRIELDSPDAPDALLGATLARAMQICESCPEPSRIFSRCTPQDTALARRLEAFGFQDNDGLIRMELRLPALLSAKEPAGCAVVYDDLSDPLEQKYFLERYNQLYNTDHDIHWLRQFINRQDFMRILTVASSGMAGEVLIWREQYSGVIGYIQTSKRWRRLGVASYMISLACDTFEQMGLYCAEANIRVRYPYMLRLMKGAGFEQSDLLMRYPGIDFNPA